MGGAGACHSDLHILHESDSSPWPLPFTLGHENAGWVHEIGAGVTGLHEGQAVAVYGAWGCGACPRCLVGKDNYCEDPMSMPTPYGGCGLGADGGMAEYLLVPAARHLVPLPDGLSPADAAPLSDAGLTPYHAIRRSAAKLDPTATAVVIGAGGLGHIAVQILKAITPARVVAVDTKAEALELATSLGADQVIQAGDETAAAIRQATGGHGADVVLDFVGTEGTLHTAIGSARTLGDVTLVGVAGGTQTVRVLRRAVRGIHAVGVLGQPARAGRAVGAGGPGPGATGDQHLPPGPGGGRVPGPARGAYLGKSGSNPEYGAIAL